MKVVIFDEMNEPMALGQIIYRETVTVDDPFGHPLCKIKTPVIVTEDGEILRGYECWWIDYEDFVTVNHMMLYKQKVVS